MLLHKIPQVLTMINGFKKISAYPGHLKPNEPNKYKKCSSIMRKNLNPVLSFYELKKIMKINLKQIALFLSAKLIFQTHNPDKCIK